MKKQRISFAICLLTALLVLLSACGGASNSVSSISKNQTKSSTNRSNKNKNSSNNTGGSAANSPKTEKPSTHSLNNSSSVPNVKRDNNNGSQVNQSMDSNKNTRQKASTSYVQVSSTQTASVSDKKMEQLKETLRTYIFDTYMPGPNYVYAKGVNWSKIFYDHLTAKEIWNVIETFKQTNNGKAGTLFQEARYLSLHAPIQDDWKGLFMKEWKGSYLSKGNQIEKLVDHGETAGVYTKSHPYTGDKGNGPFITLNKRTGYWHG